MFKKPFTVKSNNNVRSSDRRKLLARFPIGSEISSKSTFSVLKVLSFNGHQMNVYVCDKDPILFEFQNEENLFPSLYFTWICPTCVPVLLIPPSVMEFIENGADLMLPGVYLPPDYLFPEFGKDVPVAIAVHSQDTETIFPVAVGSSLMSSTEMIACGMKGKGVNILHSYQDTLWEFGTKTKPPKIELSRVYKSKNAVNDNVEQATSQQDMDEQQNVEETENTPENMDELLTNVFLWTLKTNGSSIQLPIDVGQFYANYILKQLPSGTKLDLKKTSFKKFGTFLKIINESEDPLIKVVSKKGLDSIHEIHMENERIKNALSVGGIEASSSETPNTTEHARISECFSITEAVAPFFKLYGYKKSDVVQSNQVREILIEYGTTNNLLNEDKKKIELDDTLQTLVRHFFPDKILLNDLVQKIGGQMTKAFVVTLPDGRRNIRRDKMPSIQFGVEKRSGNKVVTLLNNTAFFGIDANAFCKRIQTSLATGATIHQDVPNCEGSQILLHGNHVFYIGELLQNEYGIQKKFIKGLELGVKPKKTKR